MSYHQNAYIPLQIEIFYALSSPDPHLPVILVEDFLLPAASLLHYADLHNSSIKLNELVATIILKRISCFV